MLCRVPAEQNLLMVTSQSKVHIIILFLKHHIFCFLHLVELRSKFCGFEKIYISRKLVFIFISMILEVSWFICCNWLFQILIVPHESVLITIINVGFDSAVASQFTDEIIIFKYYLLWQCNMKDIFKSSGFSKFYHCISYILYLFATLCI